MIVIVIDSRAPVTVDAENFIPKKYLIVHTNS